MESVRVLWASKIDSASLELQTNLLNILNEAVDYNSKNGINGVLYYGHGYFIHCMEGAKDAVDYVFNDVILKDTRHHDCKLLSYETFEVGLFKGWRMKYAPVNQKIKKFFALHHAGQFDPFLLSVETIPLFIKLIVE